MSAFFSAARTSLFAMAVPVFIEGPSTRAGAILVLVVYLVVEQFDEVVEHLALHVTHVILFLSILAYLAYP